MIAVPTHEQRAAAYDCRTCGACCVGDSTATHGHALVLPSEVLPATLPVIAHDGRLRIATKDCGDKHLRCVGLDGEIGVSVTCSVYAARPTVCHMFEKGSHACAHERRRLGIQTHEERLHG